MTRTRAKRRSEKCDSCRKLKIACDKVRPSCEYCIATNRQCVYEIDNVVATSSIVTLGSVGDVEPQVAYMPPRLVVQSINDMTNHLQITAYELKLMKFFCDGYLARLIDQHQLHQSIGVQVPYTWTKSPLLRHTVYSLSCLVLYDLQQTGRNYPTDLTSPSLYLQTMHHFQQCLRLNRAIVAEMSRTNKQIKDIDQGLEIVLSGILLFTFLIIQSFSIIPLVSFDNSPDLLAMVRGMKLTIGPSFDVLVNSPFESLLKLSSELCVVGMTSNFPFTDHLKHELSLLKPFIDTLSFNLYNFALDMLIGAFYNAIHDDNASYIYSWLFYMENGTHDLMQQQEYFSLKLLFVFACFCLWGGLSIDPSNNTVSQYCHLYKQINYQRFGGWYDDQDYYCYILCLRSFTFPGHCLEILRTFDPKKYVIDNNLLDKHDEAVRADHHKGNMTKFKVEDVLTLGM